MLRLLKAKFCNIQQFYIHADIFFSFRETNLCLLKSEMFYGQLCQSIGFCPLWLQDILILLLTTL
jgi:hypothetical protein